VDQAAITEADIERSRADPRFKQVLLAKSLEQLLASLYRLQRNPDDPASVRNLREGTAMAVQLADLIRTIDDRLRVASGAAS